jgi:hypothetical protein
VNLDDLSASSTFEVALPDIDLSTQPTADAVRREESCSKNSNMIDFEVLDFTPPDEGTLLAELIDKKP